MSFKILSLEGGGVRGAFGAACLAEFEKLLERPLAEYFDLIAGTSTGAIIGAGLAVGAPAEDIVRLYLEHIPRIFTPAPPRRIDGWLGLLAPIIRTVFRQRLGTEVDCLLHPKYSSGALRDAFEEVFGLRTLADATRARLVIPAVDLSLGKTYVFKTPHLPGRTQDGSLRIVDVLLAATAAPTFFPHVALGDGSAFCDGGLWANHPGFVAYAEAMKIRERCRRKEIDCTFCADEIEILSVGTGTCTYSHVPPQGGAGILWWNQRFADVVSNSIDQGVHFPLKHILGERYMSINFEACWKLDEVEHLHALLELGRSKAREVIDQVAPRFFATPVRPYTPFVDRLPITHHAEL